jgi:hypothetical protein
MNPMPDHVHRGRYLLLLVALFVVLFMGGMMALGAWNPPEPTLRWMRPAVAAVSWVVAFVVAQRLARGKGPRWLFKGPSA